MTQYTPEFLILNPSKTTLLVNSKTLPAGQYSCLSDPLCHLLPVKAFLVDIKPPGIRVLPRARWLGAQHCSVQECELHVPGEYVVTRKPPHPLHPVPRRIPPHSLLHPGNSSHYHIVQPSPNVLLPAGHHSDVSLYRAIPISLRNLWVAA